MSIDEITREDLECLARDVMGWTVERSPDGNGSWADNPLAPGHGCFLYLSGDFVPTWNPFADANADLLVLERVREIWARGRSEDAHDKWGVFDEKLGYASDYEMGDFARAALYTFSVDPNDYPQAPGSSWLTEPPE